MNEEHTEYDVTKSPLTSVLYAAIAEIRIGEYSAALSKLLWFHHHSHDSSEFYGIRLSVALLHWKALAEVYPLARKALVDTRNSTTSRFLDAEFPFELFHDIYAINKLLGESEQTVKLFLLVRSKDPSSAQQIYHLVERLLIEARMTAVCMEFLHPERRMSMVTSGVSLLRPLDPPDGGDGLPTSKFWLISEVAQVVTILALNGNHDHAQQIVEESLAIMDNEIMRNAMKAALNGVLLELE
ncbi:hypothetical protein [Schlesneria paludicola]|uniref:hypothetical protein n=1 Tax=Schlesneria paludicola TaxID=360056 RepID=UPI00029A1016|nr:hypothetical protein [Schlesneria paludicola]